MKVVHNEGAQWRVDLGIKGNRGFAGILGLNIQQSTVFDDIGGQFRPLTQSTVRKGLFLGKKVNGAYAWNTHTAQWKGSIDRKSTRLHSSHSCASRMTFSAGKKKNTT